MTTARIVKFLDEHSGKKEREQETGDKPMPLCSNVDIPVRPGTPNPFLTVNHLDNSEAKIGEPGARPRVRRLKSPPPPIAPGPLTHPEVSVEPSNKKTAKFADLRARPRLIPRAPRRPRLPSAPPSCVDHPQVSIHPQFDNFQQGPTLELNGPAKMAFSFGTSTPKPTINLGMSSTAPANPGTSLL